MSEDLKKMKDNTKKNLENIFKEFEKIEGESVAGLSIKECASGAFYKFKEGYHSWLVVFKNGRVVTKNKNGDTFLHYYDEKKSFLTILPL